MPLPGQITLDKAQDPGYLARTSIYRSRSSDKDDWEKSKESMLMFGWVVFFGVIVFLVGLKLSKKISLKSGIAIGAIAVAILTSILIGYTIDHPGYYSYSKLKKYEQENESGQLNVSGIALSELQSNLDANLQYRTKLGAIGISWLVIALFAIFIYRDHERERLTNEEVKKRVVPN